MGGRAVTALVAEEQSLLLDTHVLVRLTNGDRRLGVQAKEAIRCAYSEDRALLSAITPWEIALLVSKGRLTLDQDVMDWVRSALSLPGVRLAPLSAEITVASTRLPGRCTPPTASSSPVPAISVQSWSPPTRR
jgi:PIN domain nuclease of toxin-antitoxin system